MNRDAMDAQAAYSSPSVAYAPSNVSLGKFARVPGSSMGLMGPPGPPAPAQGTSVRQASSLIIPPRYGTVGVKNNI